LPRFDSGSCFAALVGRPENGRWLIAPASEIKRRSRRYRDRTLILETEFETADGVVAVVDFMPPRHRNPHVIRLVVGKRGRVAMRTEFIIRFGYGAILPWVSKVEPNALRAIGGPDMTVLRTPIELFGKGFTTVGQFTVAAGETVPFVLGSSRSHGPMPPAIDAEAELRRTEKYWLDWTEHLPRSNRWSEAATRSLITLKALIYGPSGGIVASPTTSLPEHPRGWRNWDYRMCWVRDATFTLLALMNNGYFEEAKAWHEWLIRSIAGDPAKIQVMYGLTGERRLDESKVDWLSGFGGAQPVRIGNAAERQLQLDIYGELVDALYQGHCGKLPIDETGWSVQCKLLEHLETIWREPDSGIWESRGRGRKYTYSKVMVWVAFDRAIRSVERFGLKGPVDHWRAMQKRVKDEVCRKGYHASVGAFTQSYGSKRLDASLLLMPLVGFLPVTDERVRSTVDAIEHRLMHDGLLMRYEEEEREGAFLACSFWLADVLILLNRRDDAIELMERLLSLQNDVGLLAEEYDVRSKRLAGNFPQAISHVALVNTVHNLTRVDKPLPQRLARHMHYHEERRGN
jgi:GH15 family glucan-1,4-alpha-glucosidase